MKKIKEFFDKKQSELKFKTAGAGHKLSDSSKASAPSTSKNTETTSVASSRRTGPDTNVTNAALARFEGKTVQNKTITKPLNDIITEERKKISEEMKLKDEELEAQKKRQKATDEGQRNPFKEFEDSQRFTCTALDINSSLSFGELICKVKANIFDNFENDPILKSSMILFNCNRTINQDQTRLQACLEILKKVVSNLQTDNPEELAKFKKIRRSKIEQKVISLDGALDLLFAMGFTIDPNDIDWLVYDEQGDDDLKKKMQFVYELLDLPQIFPFELDRQLKYITEGTEVSQESNDDLKLTSSDFKQFYSNLEKSREINEMLISKETKAKLLSNSSNFKSTFSKLRFKLSLTDNEIETVEALFYSSENLSDVKIWLVGTFSPLFDEKDIRFKVGPDLFANDSLALSLADLKLTPAATLIVIAK